MHRKFQVNPASRTSTTQSVIEDKIGDSSLHHHPMIGAQQGASGISRANGVTFGVVDEPKIKVQVSDRLF